MIEQTRRNVSGMVTSVDSMSQSDMPSSKALFYALQEHVEPKTIAAGQRIALKHGSSSQVCILDTGMLMLTAGGEEDCRTVLSLFYDGDLSCSLFSGPLRRVKLTAQMSSRYLILPLSKFETILSHNPDLIRIYTKSCSRLLARQAFHTSSLSLLTCEEKLATLLIEISLNIGRTANEGISLELPLSRKDISDYLALNVDTVSRTMSIFKTNGLVASVGRHHLIILQPMGLLERTPLGNELIELHRGAECASLYL